MLTLFEGDINRERKKAGGEQHVKFVMARDQAAKALDPAKQTLHVVALLVASPSEFAGIEPPWVGPDHWDEAKSVNQGAGFIALRGAVQRQRPA